MAKVRLAHRVGFLELTNTASHKVKVIKVSKTARLSSIGGPIQVQSIFCCEKKMASCLDRCRSFVRYEKVDGDGGTTAARVVFDPDRRAVSISDTPANREPETRTTGLCGDKGVENLSEDVLRNSTAGVAHLRQQRGGPCAFSPGQSGC